MVIKNYKNLENFKFHYLSVYYEIKDIITFIDYLNECKLEYNKFYSEALSNYQKELEFYTYYEIIEIVRNSNKINRHILVDSLEKLVNEMPKPNIENTEKRKPIFNEFDAIYHSEQFRGIAIGYICKEYSKILCFIEDEKIKIEISNQTTPTEPIPTEPPSKLNAPEKIAVLELLGVFGEIARKGVKPENEFRIIQSLIGGNETNIKTYCLNRKNKNNSSDKCQITDKHKENAKNFLNSKSW